MKRGNLELERAYVLAERVVEPRGGGVAAARAGEQEESQNQAAWGPECFSICLTK